MLKLLQSIFGGQEAPGRYPDSLIEMATERAIDGTYPRLRALPGYRKQLRAPVIKAIDHVIALVDGFPPPVPAFSTHYSTLPLLSALFVSPEQMRETLGNDPALSEFRDSHPGGEPVTALLLADCREKNTLGMAMEGDMLRRDVAQVTVSFSQHRLLEPEQHEAEARRLLKRRAFDHLISLALGRIGDAKCERVELKQQRDLLRSKLGILQRGGWSFAGSSGEGGDNAELQAELETVEKQLAGLKVDDHNLTGQLDILSDVLDQAERNLWREPVELHLDRMNVKCDAGNPDARTIRFDELHNALGIKAAMLLVTVNPVELPQRASFAARSARLLAELGGSAPHP